MQKTKYDIKTIGNSIGGRQGWAYVCNSHTIPVLLADFTRNARSDNYRSFDKVCVHKKLKSSNHDLNVYGTLVFIGDINSVEGDFEIESGGCCIKASFDYSDALELVNNSQAPVVGRDDIVAVCIKEKTKLTLRLYRVGAIDTNCSTMCNLKPLTDEEMKIVVTAATAWCEQ